MRTTNGGIAVMLLGLNMMASALIIGIFAGPFSWEQVVLLVILFLVGVFASVGGSEIKN